MPPKPTDRFTYSRNGGGNADERCVIRVTIPGVESDAQQRTRYKIDVTNAQTRQTWQTSHRYSEFLALRNDLLAHFAAAERKCPGCMSFEKVIQLFEFPSKRYFTSKNAVVINYRKSALRSFLALLASHTFTTSPKCPTCSGMPFTTVRDFLTEDVPGAASSPTSSMGSDLDGDHESAVRESVRETIQAKNFTTYVAPPRSAPVNSDGVFIRQRSKDAKDKRLAPERPPPVSIMSSKKKTPKNKAPPPVPQEQVPSPASSHSASKSTASLPPSPTQVAANGVHHDEAESFVSFSGPAGDVETKAQRTKGTRPPTPKRVDAEQARRDDAASFVSFSGPSETQASSPRRGSSKTRRNKKNKNDSSRLSLDSQGSVKESQDDEFGSLNMDFLQSVSLAKD